MKFRDAIVSRVKIMSKLDIAEKRLPQDGRIKIRFNENGQPKEIDFRVSVLPTLFGEKIVMRLLDKDKLMLDMTRLGFEPESLEKFERAILRPWGMVLVTGPTGSGKTNTLYSSICEDQHAGNQHHDRRGSGRVQPRRHQPGAGQREHRPELRRRRCARSCARTRTSSWSAKSATSRPRKSRVKAALTGHLVLSTLHTNDAPSTINRLMNMGIEPFLVAELGAPDLRAAPGAACLLATARSRIRMPPPALVQAGFTQDEADTRDAD